MNILSKEQFQNAFNQAVSNGASHNDAVNQLIDSSRNSKAYAQQYYATTNPNRPLSKDEFANQYNTAKQNGVSGQQAIADLSSGKSFLNEALGNTNTEESYLDKAAKELYDGKKGLGEKLIRAGAQVASFGNTAKAGAARGLGNALEDTADAIITALTGLNKKETSAYQIANDIERVPNAASINDKNIYKGVGKTAYARAEWDAISAQDKKRLSRIGINSLDEFNTALASANEKMGARKTAHGLNETQGLGAKLNEKAMEWQEKAGEHAYVSTYGLGDEWGDGRLEKMVLELIPSLAGMMTDGAISMVTGVPSLGVMSVRTYLDSYNNAMSKGVSEDKANVYALAHSAVETLSEMIGGEGAVGLLYGAGLTDKAFEKAIGKIGNKTLQKIAYLVGSGASEGIEEVFSQISEPFTESILETDWGKSVKKLWGEQKFRDYVDAFLGGFLSSAVATGATNITSGAVNAAYGNGFTTVTDMQLADINQEFGKPVVQLETTQKTQQTPAQAMPSQNNEAIAHMLQNELNSYSGDDSLRTQKSREAYNRYATNVLSRAYTDSVLTDGDGNTFARVISADSNGYVIAVKTANGESPVIIPIVNNGNDGFFDILTDGGTNLQNYFEQGFTFVDPAEIEAINNERAAQQNAEEQASYIDEQNEAQRPVYNPEDMTNALNEVSMQMDDEQRNDYLDAPAASEEPARSRASQYFEPIIQQAVSQNAPQKQPQNARADVSEITNKNTPNVPENASQVANDEFNTKIEGNADSNTLEQPTEDANPKYKKLTDEEIQDKLEKLNNFTGTESPRQFFTENDKNTARSLLNQWFAYYGMKGDPDNAADREKVLAMITGIGEDTGRIASAKTVNNTEQYTKLKKQIADYEAQIKELQQKEEQDGDTETEILFIKNKIADAKDKINTLTRKLDAAGVNVEALANGDDENIQRSTEAMKLSLGDERSIMFALAALSDNPKVSTIAENSLENQFRDATKEFAENPKEEKQTRKGSAELYEPETTVETDTWFDEHVDNGEKAVQDFDMNIEKYDPRAVVDENTYLGNAWKLKYKGQTYVYSSGGNVIDEQTKERGPKYYRNILPKKVIGTLKKVYDKYQKRLNFLDSKITEMQEKYNTAKGNNLSNNASAYAEQLINYRNEKAKLEKTLALFDDGSYTLNKAVTGRDFPIEIKAALAGIDAQVYGNISLKGIKNAVSQEYVKKMIDGDNDYAKNYGISSQSQGFPPVQGLSYGEGLRGENNQGTRSGTELSAEEIASSDAEAGTDLSKYGLTRAERAGLLGSLSDDERKQFAETFGSRFTREQFDAFKQGETDSGTGRKKTKSPPTVFGESSSQSEVFDAEQRRERAREFGLKVSNVFRKAFSVKDALARIKNGASGHIENTKSYYLGLKNSEHGCVVSNQREYDLKSPAKGTERVATKLNRRNDMSVVYGDSIYYLSTKNGKKHGALIGGLRITQNGKTTIFANNPLNLAHESNHDDCDFAKDSASFAAEHSEPFGDYLETELRKAFKEIGADYDAFDNKLLDLYEYDEISEELFSELSAVASTSMESEWDSQGISFTEVGKKLANNETFKKLVSDVERYYEEGYADYASFNNIPVNSKFKKLDSDTAPHGGLSVNGAETQFKQLDGVTQKASNAFEAAAKRIEKSRSAYDKNEEFVAFKDSITKVMSGETSFADFYKSYKGLEKSDTMKAYHDRTVDGMLEMTQHLREKAEKEPTAQNIAAFQEQAATAMQALAHRVDTVNVTIKDDLSQATKLAMKNGKVDPKDKSVKTFIKNLGARLQLLDQTMFKSWGGFDEKSRNFFYRLASEAERAHANEAKNRVHLKSFFNEIGKDKSKAMRSLLSGEAKTGITVNTENGPYELSWLDAMSLVDSIETHGLKESASITSVVFAKAGDKNSKGGKLKFEEGESIIDLYNQVKKAMDGNNEVRTLKDAATEMFADAWPKLAEAYKRNTGVELGKRESYFPLAWASEKAGEKSDDFVRSLDTAALHRRTRTEEGSLLVRPYTEVIDKYIGSVSNYMAYSELGTKLEIMQNGALGVDGLSGTLKGTFGEQAGKWYDEYTRVINNYEAEEDMYGLNKFARKLRSNFAQGSLLFSVSTPAKQITALPTIQGVVSPMAMRQAMLYQKKAGYNFKEHAKANPLYAALRMGGIDPDIAAFMNSDALTKASRKSGVVATMANLNAIVDAKDSELIFKACALDVKMNNPSVKVGSELFNTLVENKFQEAVVNINPVYNTKARAEVGRTNNELVRFMTMFRTQQTQMYNRLATSIGEYKAAVKNGSESDIKAKKETLTQTVKGQAEAAVFMAAVQFAVDMMLHKRRKYDSDDDDEPDAEGILKRAFIETTKSLSDVVLGGQQIAEYALDMFFANDEYSKESSGFSLGPIDTIGKFLKSIQTLRLDFTKEEIEKGTYGNVASDARYVLTNGATLLGIPANSVYNIANSIIMAAKDLSGNNDKRYDDMAKALDNARKDFGNKLFSAYLDSNKAKANKYIDLAGDRLTTHLNNTVLTQVKKGDYTDETLAGYLLSYGDYDDEADAMAAIRKVHLEADTGIKYNNIAKEYKDGNITKEQALAYWQAYGGLSEAEAQKKLRSADYNKNTGLKYENLYSDFVKGKITEADYRAELEKANANDVLDPTAEIDTKIAEARYEKMTGVHYETIGEDYRSGKITADQLINARMAIKGETRDEAKLYLETQNFKKKFNVNYTDMKKLYRQGKISAADAITWRMKAGGASQNSAESWVKAQDIFLDTGYEPDGKYISTYYDSYATSATIGTNTFYDKYINEFSSHKGFGKVFNALNDPAQSAKSEYATNYGALSPKQTGVIDILNENIADGTISYSLTKRIWTEYCGYKASSQAFRFVG